MHRHDMTRRSGAAETEASEKSGKNGRAAVQEQLELQMDDRRPSPTGRGQRRRQPPNAMPKVAPHPNGAVAAVTRLARLVRSDHGHVTPRIGQAVRKIGGVRRDSGGPAVTNPQTWIRRDQRDIGDTVS
jgi:hypothetical protein